MDNLNKFKDDLLKSLSRGLNVLSFDELIAKVTNGSLFVSCDDNGVIVFEKKVFGGKQIVNTILCGGSLKSVADLQKKLEKDAQQNGADGAMIIGRKGWGRIFNGYDDAATLYFKEFAK